MLKQKIKKIEKQVIGVDHQKEKRIEAHYNYLLTGEESYLESIGPCTGTEILNAFLKAERKAKEIGIENVKGLKAIKEKAKKGFKGVEIGKPKKICRSHEEEKFRGCT